MMANIIIIIIIMNSPRLDQIVDLLPSSVCLVGTESSFIVNPNPYRRQSANRMDGPVVNIDYLFLVLLVQHPETICYSELYKKSTRNHPEC